MVNYEAISSSRNQLINELVREEQVYDSYEKWYASCESIRKQIYRKYILFRTPWNTLRINKKADLRWHVDHHVISYLAPLSFKRIGWGGIRRSPVEQVKMISDLFENNGVRFIYVPLPNKCFIYPELLGIKYYDEGGRIPNSPQWRKYIKDLALQNIELVDVYSEFVSLKEKESEFLFGQDVHTVSSYGATIIARKISEYLKCTCDGDEGDGGHTCIVLKKKRDYLSNQTLYRCFADDDICLCSKNSSIALIGDCNLQKYSSIGAGIAANLSRYYEYEVENVGRKLVFCNDAPLDKNTINYLKNKKIVIYIAFASAPYVRSDYFSFSHLGLIMNWNRLEL